MSPTLTRPETPNHALQRTRSAVTLAASCRRLSPTMQPACQLRESLSLGSLGDSARVLSIMHFVILLFACFMSSACAFRCTTRPGVAGTVIDAQTGKPLPRATITLGRSDNAISAQATSDGTFTLQAQKKWGFFSTFDAFPRRYPLSILHSGYSSFRTEIVSSPSGDTPAIKSLGPVSLKPQ